MEHLRCYTFVVKFTRTGVAGRHQPSGYGESLGDTELSVDDKVVATTAMIRMKAQVGKFTLCGDGLCVGYDSADAVSKEYSDMENPSNPFTGGTIEKVVITPGGDPRGQPEAARGSVRRRLKVIKHEARAMEVFMARELGLVFEVIDRGLRHQ